MTWTEEQVRALVTDAGTLKRGQELAAPTKWGNLGQTEVMVWGECAGSGAKPYQTGIDLTDLAFKCSCPSRVFPCKHGVGLLLLMVRQPQLVAATTSPSWLTDWISQRQARQQEQAKKAVSKTNSAPPDTAAREKREAQRLQRMTTSAAEFEAWLLDLMRTGLVSLEKQPASYWENQAARLVDGQLPGLATMVRELASLRHTGPTWTERLFARLGEVYLLVRSFQNIDHLSGPARHEVLQQLGVSNKKEEVAATGSLVHDTWDVVGQLIWEEERVTARRTWLWGRATRRFALLLDYAFGGQGFPTALVPQSRYEAALVFYPGLLPLRATAETLTFRGPALDPCPAVSSNELLEAYAQALSQNPWLRALPACLGSVRPVLLPTNNWVLQDALTRQQLPLTCSLSEAWQMLAVGGGHPMRVFGEWNGRSFQPLAYEPLVSAPSITQA